MTNENPAACAAQAEPEHQRPDRREHLEKIAKSVAPVEYAADDPSRSAGRHRNASGPKAPPHLEVGVGR